MNHQHCVALGLKAHSGWAALVVVGKQDGEFAVIDRRRIELVEDRDAIWAKQPYHAAEGKPSGEAREIVKRGIDSARRIAVRELRAAVKRSRASGLAVEGCAVLTGSPMPKWSVEQILAVHFRMHTAEGVLFRDVLVRAALACELSVVQIPQKTLFEHAGAALAIKHGELQRIIAKLGKSVGPPWGSDQKAAALAAMVALKVRRGV